MLVNSALGRRVRLASVAMLVLALGHPAAAWSSDQPQASGRAAQELVTPREGYGFTAGAPILTLSDVALATQLDAVVDAGGRWLRMPMSWLTAEPARGEFDWSRLDRVVEAARGRGLKVLGVLGGTPTWASTQGDAAAPPDDPADFGAFVDAAARHFKKRVRHWEVWNEPNHSSFFSGTVEQYTDLLREAHDAITRVQRSSKIVLGGLSRSQLGRAEAPATFVRDVYSAGGGDYFDALGLHPYVRALDTETDEIRVWRELKQARRVMRSEGDRKRKVWLTEVGWSTWLGGWTEARAADHALALLDRAERLRWVGMAVLYSIQDRGRNIASVHDNYGALLNFSGAPKMLFDRLHSSVGEGG